MPVIKVYGGLGNQLFQYSFGYAVSKATHEDIILDVSFYKMRKWPSFNLDKLNAPYKKVISCFEKGFIGRQMAKIYRRILFKNYSFYKEKDAFEIKDFEDVLMTNTYYDGYFCNFRFFDIYKKELQNIFQPNFSFSGNDLSLLNNIRKDNSVSIHFRRGDYVKIGCSINSEYYSDAIKMITRNNEQYTFYVFSDDIDYAVNTLKRIYKNINIVPVILKNTPNKDVIEFFLMKECKKHIIANSTFSWWAAYLSEDISPICPIAGNWQDSFYPDKWVRINATIEKKEN